MKKPKKTSYMMRWMERRVPVPYARLTQQLNFEDQHGLLDAGHESLRRMAYARRVLNAFGKELEAYRGDESRFRSRVLTPILQRQLRGLPDCYTPIIHSYISQTDGKVTIADATRFYLGVDPIDTSCIISYRRNLIYNREAKWHLMVLTGKTFPGDRETYNRTLRDHDEVLNEMRTRGGDESYLTLSPTETRVLINDRLLHVLDEELGEVVRTAVHTRATPPNHMTI